MTALGIAAAIEILDQEHRAVRRLADRLTDAQLERPATIGGGDWSAKDLLGHLGAWEENALGALEAWRAGEVAPIDRALRARGLTVVNAEAAAADRARTAAAVRQRFDSVQRRLIEALRAIPAEAWATPPTRRSRRATAAIVGSILGGPDGPFRHASAHLRDLERYVSSLSE